MKKKMEITPEQAMKQVKKVFRKRGTKALEMARKEISEEKIESQEAREALNYFMTEYWHDLTRPSLMSIVCEAVGGNPESTTPFAIPLILISGGIDIHDDIIDQSKRKNGRPTVYGKFGRDIALLIGDALLFKGLLLLNNVATGQVSAKQIRTILGIVDSMFFELGDAETLELKFRSNFNVTPKEYLRLVRKKSADVEALTRISSIVGDASPTQIESLGHFGRLLGSLSILRDDWIDVLDVEEMRNRIKKESLPLPIIYGLQHPVSKEKLRQVLLRKNITTEDAQLILKIIEKSDVPQKYLRVMSELVQQAISSIELQKVKSDNLKSLAYAMLSHMEIENTSNV